MAILYAICNTDRFFCPQESLKRRKLSFELKEKEIEAALAIEEEKEKRWLDDGKDEAANLSVNNEGNPGTASADKDTGEIQHENNLKAHGKLCFDIL